MKHPAETDLSAFATLDPAHHLHSDTAATQAALDALHTRIEDEPRQHPVIDVPPVAGIVDEVRPARRARRPRRQLLAAAAITAVGAATTITAFVAVSGGTTSPAGSDAAATVAQWAPLAQGATVACPGGEVPVEALAAEPGAENAHGPAADALRGFLANNPFAGMGSVTSTNWALLQQTPDQLIFGQREGPLGVGSVVVLTRGTAGYTATQMSGCSGVTLADGETASVVLDAQADGNRLTLHWNATTPDCGKSHDTLRRVEVDQSAAAVHVIVVVEHPTPTPDPSPGIACAGVGTDADRPSTTITLDTPLGDRPLYDDGRVSANPIHVD